MAPHASSPLTPLQSRLLVFLASQEAPTTVARLTRLTGLGTPRDASRLLTALYRRGLATLGEQNGRDVWGITAKGRKRVAT